MKTETVNAIGQRGSMWIGSPSGSRAGFRLVDHRTTVPT